MWKRRKSEPTANLLDLVPVRVLEYDTDEEGRVTLRKPRFRSRLLLGFLPRLARRQDTVRLDRYGSHVWELIDGTADVREIGVSLREVFGEEVEPVYHRLGLFCRQLAANGFIRLTGWPEEIASPME